MHSVDDVPTQIKRLVEWHTEMLRKLLKQIVAQREALGKQPWDEEPILQREEGAAVVDEVADFIDLPPFVHKRPHDPDLVELPIQVETQLRAFVAAVANAYHR